MKKKFNFRTYILLLLFLGLNSQNLKAQAHVPQAPPTNAPYSFIRAMYVDCADDIINDISTTYPSPSPLEQDLYNYISTNFINYIVLFRLDNLHVIGNPALEPYLKIFLKNARTQFPGLQVAAVGSSYNFFQQTNWLEIEEYILENCNPHGGTLRSLQEIDEIVNPVNPSPEQIQKSELLKFFIQAAAFSKEETPSVPTGSGTLTCNGAFDVLYCEKEYWTNPNNAAGQALAFQEYNDMLDILTVMQWLKCNYGCIKSIDAEFNPKEFNATGLWTALTQIQGVDPLLDRATMPCYVKPAWWNIAFDWQCENFKYMADPSTKPHSLIFAQFSAESPNFAFCDNANIPGDYLGDYLNGVGSPTGNMYSVEDAFLNLLNSSAYVCPNCACNTYGYNHWDNTLHMNENEITGSIWFTYTMMNDYNLTRTANQVSSNIALNSQLKISPNPTGNYINIHISSGRSIIEIQLFNIAGQLIRQVKSAKRSNSLTLDLSELTGGVYQIRIYDDTGNITNETLIRY